MPLGGPLQVSVSFCTTPLSLGKAETVHIGPDGKPVEVHAPMSDAEIEATRPQVRRKD